MLAGSFPEFVRRQAIVVDDFVQIADREVERVDLGHGVFRQRLRRNDVAPGREYQVGQVLGLQPVVGVSGQQNGVGVHMALVGQYAGSGAVADPGDR